jgi:hypothetical protein
MFVTTCVLPDDQFLSALIAAIIWDSILRMRDLVVCLECIVAGMGVNCNPLCDTSRTGWIRPRLA